MCQVKTSEKAGECFLPQLPGGAGAQCWGSPSWGSVLPAVPLSLCSVSAGACGTMSCRMHCLRLPREILSLQPRTGQLRSLCPSWSFSTCTAARAKSPLLQSSFYGFFCLELQIGRVSSLGTISLLSIQFLQDFSFNFPRYIWFQAPQHLPFCG